MLSKQKHKKAMRLLLEAEKNVVPVPQLDMTFPGLDIADAYEIQKLVIAEKLAGGATLRGHKIGLTSRAMQSALGIDEPDYGHLLDNMFYYDGDRIPADRFIVPRVEVELAFVLGKQLKGPNVSLFDVLDATEFVQPSLELVDGRTQYPRRIVDNIADNAASAAVVLGGRVVRPMDTDLRWVSALLYKNGTIEESGVSAAVLGHPAMGVVWLANKIAEFGGVLEKGHIVLAGSFTRTVPVAKGDVIHADFGTLGSISVSFT